MTPGTRIRSAITGRFVRAATALRHPRTTVVEAPALRHAEDRALLMRFVARLHRTAALSVPPADLAEAIEAELAEADR